VHHTRGDSFSRAGQIEVTEGSTNVSDMTHWTGRCQVRTQSGQLVQQVSFAWLDASQRLFALYATEQETAAWPSGTHNIEIELTTPAGQRVTCYRDQLVLTGDIARG
jgi:hypothetical protein